MVTSWSLQETNNALTAALQTLLATKAITKEERTAAYSLFCEIEGKADRSLRAFGKHVKLTKAVTSSRTPNTDQGKKRHCEMEVKEEEDEMKEESPSPSPTPIIIKEEADELKEDNLRPKSTPVKVKSENVQELGESTTSQLQLRTPQSMSKRKRSDAGCTPASAIKLDDENGEEDDRGRGTPRRQLFFDLVGKDSDSCT